MKQYNDLFKIIPREGYIFIASIALLCFLLASFNEKLGCIGCIVTAWCIYFFRNPDRFVPISDDLVISPADGTFQENKSALSPPELRLGDVEMVRVSIFLNIFNVHVLLEFRYTEKL